MRIGVVSDTHRNTAFLAKVAEWLSAKQHIAALYHLGDDYEDVSGLADQYVDIVQVPGIYDERYRSGSLAAKAVESVLGVRILLVHSLEKDFSEADRESADIVLHGHTHKCELRVDDGRLYFNPGHLKADRDKNSPATFGLLDIQDKSIKASIHDLKFAIVESIELVRSETGLYKA